MSWFTTDNSDAQEIAKMWTDYVNWEGRRKAEDGFLVKQLQKYNVHKILDMALGEGVDTVYLLQQGFEVEANELDSGFRQQAVKNAQKFGFTINPSGVDWRSLHTIYPPHIFEAIICLGNSLTFLLKKEDQFKALQEFYQLLKVGGILMIDERNYDKIRKNPTHLTGEFLFTGSKVEARWTELTDALASGELTHKETGQKAYFVVYPFKKGELLGLLKETGFSKIEQFSDYQEGDNNDADFYQYVCIK